LASYLLTDRTNPSTTGGKVKPLKQAKKAQKDLDEDDMAFLEKKRAGTHTPNTTNIAETAG
jgi:hypothetical protein